MRTTQKLNLETLFDELLKFQEEFEENEKYLLFDFRSKTGLCWELILEVANYLSLNDVVTAFSSDVLCLLWRYNKKLPIIEPSETFMRTMIHTIMPEQIVSLRIKADHHKSTIELAPPATFNHVKKLTLVNFQKNQIIDFQKYFTRLTCLSLFYEEQMCFHSFMKIFNYLNSPIKQFEIHCRNVLCSHRRTDLIFQKLNTLNYTIEHLILNIAHISMTIVNKCFQSYTTCLLKTIIDFIKIMTNIQCIHIIINQGSIEKLLDINEWKSLVTGCRKLKKVILHGKRSMLQDEKLKQQALEIQNQMSNGKRKIDFEIKLK
ncbi:unnamed protein product [Adineta steineri]|uniref:Uncharacterized protein n=1 Tax=Adineta steineri TaxID=433720 RepID=A0A815HN76_9BILA|nr:unnamed protein product [Adineta steineri]CAF1354444.1 unnamed protein product [Adineta steineri]